ncbi:hypothetical protein [Saccharopolyspora shandongensis]|uniref:hypothetical protein n=1 Tax=Saccharopolyspora shandongensis TaxID=418495 RepID=UPI0033FAE2BE
MCRETKRPGFGEFYADPDGTAVVGDLRHGDRGKFGLFQPGEGVRWAVDGSALMPGDRQALAFLPDSVALIQHQTDDDRFRERLVLLDRNTGAELRELHSTPWYDVAGSSANEEELSVIAAPGTLIAVPGTLIAVKSPWLNPYLRQTTELIGFG